MEIKRLRESKNMTQETMAEILGITRSAIAMWESGRSLPRTELLPKIAELLGCTTDELLGIPQKNKKTPMA